MRSRVPRRRHRVAAAALLLAAVVGLTGSALALDGDAAGISLQSRLYTGQPHDVVLVEPLAFVGLDTGLHVFDVADPIAPIELGHLYLPSPALDLAVSGDLVFVANGESGLQVVDIADPADPLLVGSLATSGTRGVWIDGSVAYLAEASSPPGAVFGLRTVDVSEPSSMIAVGFTPLGNGATDVVVAGSLALVTTGSELGFPDHGLTLIDVTSSVAPVAVGFLATGEPVHDVVVSGSVAFLAAGIPLSGSFLVAEISDPATPTLIDRAALGDAARSVVVVGDVAHVAAGLVGLVTYDVTTPDATERLDALPTGRDARAVAARGDLALVGERRTTGLGGLTTVSTPTPPELLAEEGSAPYADANDAAAERATAVLLRSDALDVYDSSDPTGLVLVDSWVPPGGNLSAVDLEGRVVAVCQGGAVHLFELGDTFLPTTAGLVVVSGSTAVQPVLDGQVLYVVTDEGLEVYDITSLDAPSIIGTYDADGWASAFAVDGALGYLAVGSNLHVLDLASPSSPTRIGSVALGDILYGLDATGDLVVVSGQEAYLYAIDVSSPTAPVHLATVGGGMGFDVRLYGATALVAAGRDGLLGFDLSDPMSPVPIGYYDTSGRAVAVANEGPILYLATGPAQHWVLHCDTCAAPCAVDLDLLPDDPRVCEGTEVDLTTVSASLSGCSAAELAYEWYEDAVPVAGATSSSHTVTADHAAGLFTFEVYASCFLDEACWARAEVEVTIDPETWPTVEPNSLRAVRAGSEHTLSWLVVGGSGESNIHRTLMEGELPLLHTTPASFVDSASLSTFTSAYDPATGQPALYRVFARGSCSGDSYAD